MKRTIGCRPAATTDRNLDRSIEMGMDYLEQIRHEMKHITPHREDDDDWTREGRAFLRSGQLDQAERKFKELVASQPKHHDGFEGLALTYEKLGRKEEALYFIRAAIARAQVFLEDGSLDPEVMDEIKAELRTIEAMP
jgi:Tfp pilus assembly protein PilF